ncbi:MAG: SNF2-related protein, partial [Candidatus Ornithomonoglobus sp.]
QTAAAAAVAVGTELEIEGRSFEIESIRGSEVSLIDKTFQSGAGFPIFRVEPLDRVTQWVKQQTEIKSQPEVKNVPVPDNFKITDYDIGTGGDKAKFKRNIEAIRTLKIIESEDRYATPEEQEILSQYVGWGGLAAAFDDKNGSWSNEYAQLKNMLTEDEYSAARASTLSSFYTSPTIINAMYTTLSNMGFESGNILEPSCGVGNFFGMIPDEMSDSKLYGVELDSITGRIAQKLYPHADIKVQGFEKTNMPDNFYDLCIGNVPFGDFKVADQRYNKYNFNIHDYFIAKSLDKVRAGGVVAVVVSKGFMDKANPSVRKYVAQRADLLGAIRLPNNAFKDNAGTEVISDILFFQKRDRMVEIEPEWVFVNRNEDDLPVNSYFTEHPEMVMGELKMGINKMYGRQEVICTPIEGADLSEQLAKAVSNINGYIPEITLDDISEPAEGAERVSIPADPNVKNYSYTLVDGDIYYRVNSQMDKVELPAATAERVKGMLNIRDCTRRLMELQLEDYGDDVIAEQQKELNNVYDSFTKKYGLINSLGNRRAFREDADYYLLSSLEVLDEQGNLERKADMFTKRTIKQRQEITKVETAVEALAVSIGEKARIDIPYMQELTGFSEDKIISDLKGVIYPNPMTIDETGKYAYETADEYLSGNIREKLRMAEVYAKDEPMFEANVTALKEVMPKDLEAGEIDVRLGATWIDTGYVQQFMYELLETPIGRQRDIKVNYSPYTSAWYISKKNSDYSNIKANVTYGTRRINAYEILEQSLNLRDVKIYDTVIDGEGKERRVPNEKETTLACEKQELLQSEFRDWIFRDYDRRTELVKLYNEKFNSIRPREYDGSHLVFNGMTPEIQLRPHQLNAIAHTIYGGNTLLAHEVGAGKTFEMIASAMENKRLGLCNKSLFVVPNHLTEQMGTDVLRLYPSANVLVATSKDFQKANRRRLCAKIATGDFDIVIIGHSQLEKIPVSAERQERFIQRQIDEVIEGIAELKNSNAENFQVKQLERTKKNLEVRLEKLVDSVKRDDVVTFEELGVDRMYIDEAHYFKNAYFFTKMRNVSGLAQTEAQKSADLMMKCRYMDELTGGRGTVFATGTPVSNSMVEVYTMMKYLQNDTLSHMGWQHFDAWAANFGETVTQNELAPEGKGYRSRTRFARFFNLPELMSIFKECADIKTAEVLNLPTPEAHYHNVVAEPTEIQKEMVDALSERAKRIHNKEVTPDEDNMLGITNDGRKIGLDQRLMNPMLPDEPGTKVNQCIDNVYKIWNDTAESRSTQLIFCDFSTPKGDGSFNLYDDIRDKL